MTQPPYQGAAPFPGAPQYQQYSGPYGMGPIETTTDPGLDRPWYGIGMVQAFVRAFKKFTRFDGRASRGEYWWWFLASNLVSLVLTAIFLGFCVDWAMLDQTIGIGNLPLVGGATVMIVIMSVYSLLVLIPNWTLAVRRMHDIGKSGWWLAVAAIPVIGNIWQLILLASPTYPGPTPYDPPSAGGYGTPAAGYPPVPPQPYPPSYQ